LRSNRTCEGRRAMGEKCEMERWSRLAKEVEGSGGWKPKDHS
jgi:hypothetical protein